MLAMFRALPLLARIATILGLVAVLAGSVGGLYLAVRHAGYVDGYAKASAECEAEKAKQEAANRNAVDAANRRLMDLADQLALKELEVDDYVKAIDLATAADPHGGDACLDPVSVRRLNTIR